MSDPSTVSEPTNKSADALLAGNSSRSEKSDFHSEPLAKQRPHNSDRGFAPRGLRRGDAAWYVGVSPSKLDDWVARRIMPEPKQQDGVVVWDRFALDVAIDALPDRETKKKADPYDDISL